MIALEQIEQQYKIGQPIFEKLFALNSAQIKVAVGKILRTRFDRYSHIEYLFEVGQDHNRVTKILHNDKPWELSIDAYDSIKINFNGIYVKLEHYNNFLVFPFDEYFTLNLEGI